jgi:small-conductance mechanosensitive channel
LIVALSLLVMLAIEGVNTTALITGLGVGGIAIAVIDYRVEALEKPPLD